MAGAGADVIVESQVMLLGDCLGADAELGCTGLGWAGLGWAGLGWAIHPNYGVLVYDVWAPGDRGQLSLVSSTRRPP